ncbi:hypothetical protein, partial [Stenotrophomonas maltophilia group sp. RNC7]|uniref:hypothetical protein n=1 Tax=Stenotrophomonas maltophilia group sp. RNC7 TaxID=3071467 RepID=UPI0027E049E2
VSSAQDDFQRSISEHSKRVEALADEYKKLAAILTACAVAAKNVLHYDLFGSPEYRMVMSSDRAAQQIADEFEGLVSENLKKMMGDMKLAYQHMVRI